jgi:hypothetical protein
VLILIIAGAALVAGVSKVRANGIDPAGPLVSSTVAAAELCYPFSDFILMAFIDDINREPVVHTWCYKVDNTA